MQWRQLINPKLFTIINDDNNRVNSTESCIKFHERIHFMLQIFIIINASRNISHLLLEIFLKPRVEIDFKTGFYPRTLTWNTKIVVLHVKDFVFGIMKYIAWMEAQWTCGSMVAFYDWA